MTGATLQHILRYNNNTGDIDVDGVHDIAYIISNIDKICSISLPKLKITLPASVESYMKQIFQVPEDTKGAAWFPNLSRFKEAFLSPASIGEQILFFGDSTMRAIARQDTDRRGIDALLQGLLPEYKILSIANPGYNMPVFLAFIRLLEKASAKPRLVIIPVNLRSLSSQWLLHPLYKFSLEKHILETFLSTGAISLPYISGLSAKIRVKEDTIRYLTSEANTIFPDFKKVFHFVKIKNLFSPKTRQDEITRLYCIFVFHYLSIINKNNVILKAMVEIINELGSLNIPALFYCTPINYQAGERIVGPVFSTHVTKSRLTIKQTIPATASKYINFEDYITSFQSNLFHHHDIANEHLNAQGRLELSKRLSSSARAIL